MPPTQSDLGLIRKYKRKKFEAKKNSEQYSWKKWISVVWYWRAKLIKLCDEKSFWAWANDVWIDEKLNEATWVQFNVKEFTK